MPLPDTQSTILVVLIIQVGRTVRELVRERSANKSREEARESLARRLDTVERLAKDAAEHAASLNRKAWRAQHPGQDTPDPAVEPRTASGPSPLRKKPPP